MCMFYIIVNIETPLNGWNVYEVVTSPGLLRRQVNKLANNVLMDGAACLIMDLTTCACFSRQKDFDSFACLCFLVTFH